ncbi:heme-binding protein [uncultured Microbacterium sp.]|uniref:GlcG/HbpS family heme-binding protein n=1 Tax=uncultured Microbacterium sp. TaxID=191216 RepID=UPI0035CBEEB4
MTEHANAVPPAIGTVPDITERLAVAVLESFRAHCQEAGLALAACVVDRGGNPVASTRRDGAQLGAISLAADKAFTAVAFGAPTSRWASSSRPGEADWGLAGSLGGRAVVFAGGVPLYWDGHLIGGLGVSGAASASDEACAIAAAHGAGLRTEP